MGCAIFLDIKSTYQSPSEKDRRWFPDIAGSYWLEMMYFVMHNFNDESVISQSIAPRVMRDFRLFTVLDDYHNNYLKIAAIHNEEGYQAICQELSSQYNLINL